MRADLVWYHVIWNTHGSWLPGDPRGFRNHDHRIHSSGDYRSPPPKGEHDGLHRYHQARSTPAVKLPPELRPQVANAVLDAISRRDCSAAALSVAGEHVHVLAALPPDYDTAKATAGKLKTVSSLALNEQLPGTVWSRGCHIKPVRCQDHWVATFEYIARKQEPGAYVWTWDEIEPVSTPEGSAASAAASMERTDLKHATAEAVDSSEHKAADDPTHFTQSDAVEVRRVTNRGKGGRAVFARRDIAAGELIERVPVLMIPRTQVFGPGEVAGRAARISWYVFEWLPTKRPYVALALGYGSIYNHSDDPNAAYDMEPPDVMLFSAIKPIRAGEEVLISYAGAAGVMKELGFEAEKAPPLAVHHRSSTDGGAGGEDDDSSASAQ